VDQACQTDWRWYLPVASPPCGVSDFGLQSGGLVDAAILDLRVQVNGIKKMLEEESLSKDDLFLEVGRYPTKDELQVLVKQISTDLGPSMVKASSDAALAAVEGTAGKLSDGFVAQFGTLIARLGNLEAKFRELEDSLGPPRAQRPLPWGLAVRRPCPVNGPS